MSSRLGHVWLSGIGAGRVRLGQLGGADMRRQPCMVHAGSGCEVGHCGGKVSIALISVWAEVALAVTCAVECAYGDWFRTGCLVGQPGLSRCAWVVCGTGVSCHFLTVCGFLGHGVMVQSSKISAWFAVCTGSPTSGTSSTVGWQYLSVGLVK